MKRSLPILAALLCVLLLSGCISNLLPNPAAAVPASATPVTPQYIVVTSTEEPKVIIITATPEPATVTPPATATSLPTVPPTATVDNSALSIASVTDQGNGNILVTWNASGNFPGGFQVVWSTTNQAPAFPTDSSTYVADPNARSATFKGAANQLYFVRVCRFGNNACDLYSNLGYVAVFAPTGQPLPPSSYSGGNTSNVHPTAIPNGPTPTPGNPIITIYLMKSTGPGTAVIYWTVRGGPISNGFAILSSQDASQPLIFGDMPYTRVTNSSWRVFTVNGEYLKTYYFRICRYTGTTCDSYSNVYTFTYTGTVE